MPPSLFGVFFLFLPGLMYLSGRFG